MEAPTKFKDTGIVIRSTGGSYKVKTESGKVIDCVLRGKLRLEELKTTNPVAVGDRVVYYFENEEKAVIEEILPRKNFIQRRSTRSSSFQQVLCANIDQALIVVTIDEPFTPLSFVDSFLVMAEAFRIPAIVVFNKIDIARKKEKNWEKLKDYVCIYAEIGYKVLALSALNVEDRPKIVEVLANKISFISGLSGSGKSSLINLADPKLHLKTAPISHHTKKGRHTTTYAQMYDLEFGGSIIDVPGFREFEITDIDRYELSHYFPEMRKYFHQCKFNNCTHTSEPGCAIIRAVQEGEIASTRYNTYLGMLNNLEKPVYD
ncbi:MAG: ribosome small subunit-dependent GTPase A [Bacteroidia bacterium]|nr:ribosome small subunit-dependent GTPase A [Bacteroidia bacterium]MDW8158824.1 ribosome small subunit-dependent GTPase A [Bacteroidia bacterium]